MDPAPFIPRDDDERNRRTEEIFAIQTSGLVKRMSHTGIERLVLGLSGGLDSTLALLVAVRAFDVLGAAARRHPRLHDARASAPARARAATPSAWRARAACRSQRSTSPTGCLQQFRDIGHDPAVQDVTFENVQARYRTMILMNKANQLRALVLGTGDLSEIALGWNTFNGDHISHYNVNAGRAEDAGALPGRLGGGAAARSPASREILRRHPRTRRSHRNWCGEASGAGVFQRTEEIIGPYELHDFFLYHFARWESRPAKILFLAEQAFAGQVRRRPPSASGCALFVTRFFGNQWKRSVMPDGPKVGSVALSPRGDWRMPSDAEVALWLEDLDGESDTTL